MQPSFKAWWYALAEASEFVDVALCRVLLYHAAVAGGFEQQNSGKPLEEVVSALLCGSENSFIVLVEEGRVAIAPLADEFSVSEPFALSPAEGEGVVAVHDAARLTPNVVLRGATSGASQRAKRTT